MLQAKRILGLVVVAVALTGCGTNPFQQQVQYDQYGNPITPGFNNGMGYNDPYGGGYNNGGYSDPSYGGGYNSGYGSGGFNYGTGTGTAAYPATGPITGSLSDKVTVGSLKKVKKGMLWWAKLEASGQIRNGNNMAVAGEVTYHFLKNGKVVETRTERLADLQPGDFHNFTVTSKKGADDVQVVVNAQAGTTATNDTNNPYGNGYNSGYSSGYGSGYGTDPYSSGGYGTSY